MELRQRKTRTLKVTDIKVSDEERMQLADLYQDARYEALLNLMERGCIELETAHFNTSVGDPEAVLGGHLMAKASWLFFQYIQKWVAYAYNAREADRRQAEEPEPSFEDMVQSVEGTDNYNH